MKLTVLADNYSYINKKLCGEPGFSLYIEDEDEKILFDTGYSDLFLRNAEKLGIDLSEVTKVVFSHGHDDHTGGLTALIPVLKKGVTIITHPETFSEKLRGDTQIGSIYRAEDLSEKFEMSLSKTPQKVSNNITFLGEIPSLSSFEMRKQFDMKVSERGLVPDFVDEDSAIVYEKENGIYIITGCSHAGICNICSYAMELFNKRIIAVFGGLHLKTVDDRLSKTIDFFKKMGIKELYPCHCVSFEVKAAIHDAIPIGVAGVGLEIEW